jgi:hypothetical protein
MFFEKALGAAESERYKAFTKYNITKQGRTVARGIAPYSQCLPVSAQKTKIKRRVPGPHRLLSGYLTV